MLAINYCLEDDVVDCIELYTTTFIGDNGNTKDVKLDDMLNLFEEKIRCDKNKTLPKVNVSIHDINLRVRYRVGDILPRDASCNSGYMTGAMMRVGADMRRKYSWVPMIVAVYLVLNSAGGHGTNECIVDHGVIIKHHD